MRVDLPRIPDRDVDGTFGKVRKQPGWKDCRMAENAESGDMKKQGQKYDCLLYYS